MEYTQLAESLKRLLNNKVITVQKVKSLLSTGKITESEYQYILNNESR